MFLPAHHIVQAPNSQPTVTVLFLHGILGSGRNLRTLATRLCQQIPQLRVVLVDLRGHGDSAQVGHSFGGKVGIGCTARIPMACSRCWCLPCAL